MGDYLDLRLAWNLQAANDWALSAGRFRVNSFFLSNAWGVLEWEWLSIMLLY